MLERRLKPAVVWAVCLGARANGVEEILIGVSQLCTQEREMRHRNCNSALLGN